MSRLEVDPIHLFGRLQHPDYIHMDWFSPENLARDRALDEIKRFSSIAEMTHRPTVGAHSLKVPFYGLYMSQACMELGIELDQPRIVYMGQHHDDSEIITGDIPTPVKRSASPAQKREMESNEADALKILETSTQKPTWTESIEELINEYKRQKTLESRIVNYFDKWDGLHEAVNEVVCGDNVTDFRDVIEDYRPILNNLNKKNNDWQRKISALIGDEIFEVPDPNRLVPKKASDIDFSNVFAMSASIADKNPSSYKWWLLMNGSIFKTFFFKYTLPGWEKSLPTSMQEDIDRATVKQDVLIVRSLFSDSDPQFDIETFTRTGLIVPKKFDYEIGTSLGESLLLAHDSLMAYFGRKGEEVRKRSGLQRAQGKYYGDRD